MLNKIFIIFCIAAVIQVEACRNVNEKASTHKIEQNTQVTFDKKIHSFGKIVNGETVGCYFNFKNSGKYPLVIHKVKSGCGCTDIIYPKKPILPGEKGEIEVRFDSSGFSGHQYKVVQVYANIEKNMKELVVSANVIN